MHSERTADIEPVRVVLVDDSKDVRFLLATVLELDGRFRIVGEAEDARNGLAQCADLRPDLILVDLDLGGRDGLWLIRELRKRQSGALLAVVTASDVPREHEAAMDAGADVVHTKMSMTSTMVDELADLLGVAGVPAAG